MDLNPFIEPIFFLPIYGILTHKMDIPTHERKRHPPSTPHPHAGKHTFTCARRRHAHTWTHTQTIRHTHAPCAPVPQLPVEELYAQHAKDDVEEEGHDEHIVEHREGLDDGDHQDLCHVCVWGCVGVGHKQNNINAIIMPSNVMAQYPIPPAVKDYYIYTYHTTYYTHTI